MKITYTIKDLLAQMALDAARGRKPSAADTQQCIEADERSWAEHTALIEALGDKAQEKITVDYPDYEE